MEENTPKKGRIKRILLKVLVVFLAVLLLLVSAAMLYMNYLLNRINRNDPAVEHTVSSSEADAFLGAGDDLIATTPPGTETLPDINDITFPTEPQTTAPAVTVPAKPAPQIYGDHLVNIMLVGQDRREGEIRARSDTMILISFNKSDNTITLTSFMRDMYVQIPGYKPNRMNAAYAFGGMNLLTRTMETNFGVKLDGMVEVDFGSFQKIIELLGGVRVTLTAPEAKYLNDLYYEAKILDSPVAVGENLLDPKQAEVFVRLREIDSDYRRTERQRQVISSLIRAYKDQPLDRMLSLMEEILPYVTTNLTNGQILGYAIELLPMLPSAQINTLRLPLEGTYESGRVHIREGLYAWLQYNIDFQANKVALFEVFRNKG